MTTLALLGACGGGWADDGDIDEAGDVDEYRIASAQRAQTVLTASAEKIIPASKLTPIKGLLRPVEHRRQTDQSPSLDLNQYELSDDEICGGRECPAVPDTPCEAYNVGGIRTFCACEHRGYLFACN